MMHSDSHLSTAAAAPPQHPPAATSRTTRAPRRPGRPATYVFDRPDEELTDKERKLKISIEKRRARQNKSYHRRRNAARKQANAAAAAVTAASVAASIPLSSTPPVSAATSMHSSHNNHNSLWGTTIAASTSTATLPLSIPPAPQLLPGFSQNPLDLLATAGGSLGPVPSTCASSSAATTTPSALSALTTTTTDKHSGAISDDPSARSSLFRDACMSDSQHHSILPPVEEVDATLCMPSSSQPLDMSFSFGFSQPKEEDEEQATDVFVNSALVAAKEYAKAPINLKDVLDRENELRRMTGIKQIVFDNLRTKYMNMTPSMKDALRHFVIFPRTFNLRAAVAVAGLEETQLVSMQGMLENMIQTNFITTDKGRYELNEAARLFLYEDPTVMEDTMTSGTTDTSQARFIDHYRTQLSRLQDDNIHKVGWLREEAMALYDAERQNMEFSEYLLTGRQAELREFLSAGITVMRYCVSAGNRERVLRKALLEDETSTENIFLSFGDDGAGLDAASSSNASGNDECDKSHKARLHLALSEAYFDQLKTDDAEKPLLEARKLMCDSSSHCRTTASAGVVDRVLVLLLLSNLRLSSRRFKQASAYCVQAFRILSEAGLARSTFAINAMSNLVTTYLEGDSLDKAKSVANRLLDTLNVMRYTGMPIYADALGVCAMVSMAEENYAEAERQYGTALETVGKWGSKEWTGIPVQHCLDLDVWLMEGLAEAIRRQGRTEEALALERRAAEDRRSRGLPPNSTGTEFFDPASGFQDISPSALVMPKLRHLY